MGFSNSGRLRARCGDRGAAASPRRADRGGGLDGESGGAGMRAAGVVIDWGRARGR